MSGLVPLPEGRSGLRWGIYGRISGKQGAKTGEDDDDTVSLETQETGSRAMIGLLDPTGHIVESLVVRDVWSGLELYTRPKLQTVLLPALRRGEIDAIACYHPWRWTRDPNHAGYLYSELDQHRVLIRFAQEDPGDDEKGRLVSYIQHWSGRQDHKTRTEQTHRARAELVRLGRPWGGCKAPYGLRNRYEQRQGVGGRIEQTLIGYDLEPSEAAVLSGLGRGVLAGESMRGLARGLMAKDVPAPKGGKGWSGSVIRDLLGNRVYMGEAYGLRYRLDQSDQYLGKRGKSAGRWKARRKVRDESEWVRLPDGSAPVIFSADEFAAIQDVLARAKRGGSRPGRRPTDDGQPPDPVLMGGGRARCAACGRVMTLWSRSPAVLACAGRNAPEPCPSKPAIRAAKLDRAAKRLAEEICRNPGVLAEQAELHRQSDPTAADLAMVEGTLAKIKEQQGGLLLVAQQVKNAEAAAGLALQLDQLAERLEQAEQDRAEILKRRVGWEESRRLLDTITRLAERVGEHLERFTASDWEHAIKALGITATVGGVGRGWRQQASTSPEQIPGRYRLDVRLKGKLTEALLERLAAELGATVEGGSIGVMPATSRSSLHDTHANDDTDLLTLSWSADQIAALDRPRPLPGPRRAAARATSPTAPTRAPALARA